MIETREDVRALLARVDLFAGLAPDRLGWLAEQADVVRFESGETFITMGDLPEHCYVLAEGAIDWFANDDGVETVTGHMEAVNYAGMTTTLSGDPYLISARVAQSSGRTAYRQPNHADDGDQPRGARQTAAVGRATRGR